MVDRTISMLDEPSVAGLVLGIGSAMQALNRMAAEISRTNIPVLIMGESGTGKDMYARLIHRLSEHRESRFQKINCVTLDSSRLGNHVEQAKGKFLSTDRCGTIYFDNAEELDSACQRLLLTMLPDGENSGLDEQLGARVISSTSNNILNDIQGSRFRRELYLRLNGVCLRLPPLRDRKEDLPLLTEHFLAKHGAELKKPVPRLNNEAIETLEAYSWPGNTRELENLARRIVAIGDVGLVLMDLHAGQITPPKGTVGRMSSSLKSAARAASRQTERELILRALHKTQWNRKRAAQELQISYKSLLYKIKQIRMPDGEQEN
jgi:two-component system, NtrC family, response regulator AtoC